MLSCYFGEKYQTSKKFKISSRTNKLQPPSLHDMPKVIKQKERGNKRVYKTILFCHSDRGTSANRRNNGSATIEAMLILPLFLMAAFAFYTIGNFLQAEMFVYEAMQETAQYFAEYQYVWELAETDGDAGQAEKTAGTDNGKNVRQMGTANVNCLTAKLQFEKYVDDSELLDTCVSGGRDGICFTKANYNLSDGCIYLSLKYELAAEIPFFGTIRWKKAEQICQKAYVGMLDEKTKNEDDAYVYVTETGDVYHSSRTCYHIKLAITQIDKGLLKKSYENLLPCELCASGKYTDGCIYITETGNKYHYSVACSGLKRTVMRVRRKDVGNLSPCSNCGN